MIQEITPHHLENAYTAARAPQVGDCLIYLQDDTYAVDRLTEATLSEAQTSTHQYLISVDETAYFYVETYPLPADLVWEPIQGLRLKAPRHEAFGIVTAIHLIRWYRANRYCGICGQAMVPATHERALHCRECQRSIYPTIAPAVIVAITCGDYILVTKYAHRQTPSYALVAGFVEIGETLEQCVRRESLEEVGLELDQVSYHASQPWGFTGTLLAGFWATVSPTPSGNPPPITMDTDELSQALWLRYDQLPPPPNHASLTWHMIEWWGEQPCRTAL